MAKGKSGKPRRSGIVSLSIVGVASAVWIGDGLIPEGVEMRRNLYGDRAACERDYSSSQCEPEGATTFSGTNYVSTGYHGPYYAASRSGVAVGDPGSGRSGVAHTSYATSYRGGFGAFGHAVHAAS